MIAPYVHYLNTSLKITICHRQAHYEAKNRHLKPFVIGSVSTFAESSVVIYIG